MNTSQLIAHLNAIRVGDLDGILAKLEQARQICVEHEHPDLADALTQAASALSEADLKTYRKRLETVISRLGHLR